MATVLSVLLIGLALSSTVFGTIYYISSTQEQTTALHAQTQSQMKAWTGAELVREYLRQLQTDGRLPSLVATVQTAPETTLVLTANGVTDAISAKFIAPATATELTALITGVTAAGSRAQASSTLQVIYKISAAAGGASVTKPPSVLTFNRNLKLSGSITVISNSSDKTSYEINVLGDVSTGGNSITGVKTINASGSINIGSGSSFDELNSNCDVSISGSVKATAITARRNICASGGASVPGSIRANGSVRMESGYDTNGSVFAIANATDVAFCAASGNNPAWDSTAAATCAVPQLSGVDLSAGNAGSKSVITKGNVEIASGRIGMLESQGNLTVSSNATVLGNIGGKLVKPGWNNNVNVVVMPGKMVSITSVPKLVIQTETFNANALEGMANYVFKIDSQGYKKVTVRNVQNVADGSYYLGNYNGGGYRDYLCTGLANGSSPGSATCQIPAVSASKTICQGYSDYNNCLDYSNGKWSINGRSIAPGVAWFQGNLDVGTGTYYNTFIATGNISTSGLHETYAPNFAGYDGINGGVRYAPTGICANSNFPTLIPRQLCDTVLRKYTGDADGLGNYAFMAGSRPDENYINTTSYVGGNLTLGASSIVHGSVKAGNEFSSGGSTTLQGYATALGLGSKVMNSMGGSTTFDLQRLPPTFTATGQGSGTGSSNNGGGNASSGAAANVQIRWARYK